MIEAETTPDDLAAAIARLMDDPQALATAAAAARTFGIVNAADRLADLVEECARLTAPAAERRVHP
jgi:UDP-N-acetylglucosamine:LPS N-acetylglucosamine transferase